MENSQYFYDFLNRAIPLLSKEGVDKLSQSTVAIAGCGGAGGATAVTLARMGVGNFKLADPGIFDPPDSNRQWAANVPNLGRNKTDGYEDMLLAINPAIKIKKYKEGITAGNVNDFLEGVNLVVDCLDISVSAELMRQMSGRAREKNIPIVASLIFSFGAICYCSTSSSMAMEEMIQLLAGGTSSARFPPILKEVFMPHHVDIIESRVQSHKLPSVSISSLVAAAFMSTESLMMLLGKTLPGAREPLCLPKIFVADFFRLSFMVVDISEVK